MFSLILLGTASAYFYSLAVWAGIAPGSVYFESAAVITTLVLLGQVLEARARGRARDALRALLALAPEVARRMNPEGQEETVSAAVLKPGDRVRVRAGERVPADGVIVQGESVVDESMMTGEPVPVRKAERDPVVGGTLNGNGSFVFRVERSGADSLLAGIVRTVEEAQRSRAPIQNLADSVAFYFVPAVGGVAALSFALWLWLGPAPALPKALVAAVSVLVVACPCALGLATPMSILVALGRGAREGVLIRDAETLQKLARVDLIAFDKTGTLTLGEPRFV
jgi:Cu+-exporting ATPase